MRGAKYIVVAVGLLAQRALAEEVRLLGGTDAFVATAPACPGLATDPITIACNKQVGTTAELGFSLRGEARGIADLLDVRIDYRGRYALAGDEETRSELFDLHGTLRRLAGGRLDVYFGRFGAPTGGLWLVTDGAGAHLRLPGGLAVDAFGGLRAFSTGLEELHLTSNPDALAIAGASATFDRPGAHLDLAFVYAQDHVDVVRGYNDGSDDQSVVSTVKGDLTINADALLLPHPDVTIAGSLLFSSRYDVLIGPTGFGNAPAIDVATLAAFSAHAMGEWRPSSLSRRLRLAYLFDFDRVRVLESKQPLTGAPAAAGSFEDHTLKASWRPLASLPLRLDVRYRLRFRENTDVIHRVEAGVWGDALVAGFGVFGTVGVDSYETYHLAGKDPGRWVWQAGLSFVAPWLDARAGLMYTDTTADCAAQQPVWLSSSTTKGTCAQPSALFPFVLDSQRIAFVRLFGWWGGVFGGVDAEANLDGNQLRMMAQLGYAR